MDESNTQRFFLCVTAAPQTTGGRSMRTYKVTYTVEHWYGTFVETVRVDAHDQTSLTEGFKDYTNVQIEEVEDE
jgi:hypothetical protein